MREQENSMHDFMTLTLEDIEMIEDVTDDVVPNLPIALSATRRLNPPPLPVLSSLVKELDCEEIENPEDSFDDDEPTLIMPRKELDELLRQEQKEHIHTKPTVRCMQAVVPKSCRPGPMEQAVCDDSAW